MLRLICFYVPSDYFFYLGVFKVSEVYGDGLGAKKIIWSLEGTLN
jgi:hypothetical protein